MCAKNTNGVTSDFTRGVTLAIAKPPLTAEKLKQIFGFLRYYDVSDKECKRCMVLYGNDLKDFFKERIRQNEKRRKNVLRLFNYCENDFDKEILQRRYVFNEKNYEIAYVLAYSDRMICIFLKRALERLSENAKNIAEFEY